MPRANRYYVPGYVWHITHRCHKREFLLKFAKDQRRWLAWLFEARKRYGTQILNYAVTSNHIHLLVSDSGGRDALPGSIRLAAGRTAQEYDQRKKRRGAFWEDRYHATAVETGRHLIRCMTCIDMNMVRAGAVSHPSEWPFGGYREIQNPPKRYALTDIGRLTEVFGMRNHDELRTSLRKRAEETLKKGTNVREGRWTESIAVGSRKFVEETKEKLGIRAGTKKITEGSDAYQLLESQYSYGNDPNPENGGPRSENTFFWNACPEITT